MLKDLLKMAAVFLTSSFQIVLCLQTQYRLLCFMYLAKRYFFSGVITFLSSYLLLSSGEHSMSKCSKVWSRLQLKSALIPSP